MTLSDTQIQVNDDHMSAILNFIEVKFFPVKTHISFNSNGLAIWHGFPVITHIEVNWSQVCHFKSDKFFKDLSWYIPT